MYMLFPERNAAMSRTVHLRTLLSSDSHLKRVSYVFEGKKNCTGVGSRALSRSSIRCKIAGMVCLIISIWKVCCLIASTRLLEKVDIACTTGSVPAGLAEERVFRTTILSQMSPTREIKSTAYS